MLSALTEKNSCRIASGTRFLCLVWVKREAYSVPPIKIPKGLFIPEGNNGNDKS